MRRAGGKSAAAAHLYLGPVRVTVARRLPGTPHAPRGVSVPLEPLETAGLTRSVRSTMAKKHTKPDRCRACVVRRPAASPADQPFRWR